MIRFNKVEDDNPKSLKRRKYQDEQEEIKQLADQTISEDNIHFLFGNLTLGNIDVGLQPAQSEDKVLWQNTIMKFFPYLAFTKKDKFESFPYALFAKEYCEYKEFALKNNLDMKYFKAVVLPAVSGQFDRLSDIPLEYRVFFYILATLNGYPAALESIDTKTAELALDIIAARGNYKSIQLLLDNFPLISAQALSMACKTAAERGHLEVCLILCHKFSKESEHFDGVLVTLLYCYAYQNQYDKIEEIFEENNFSQDEKCMMMAEVGRFATSLPSDLCKFRILNDLFNHLYLIDKTGLFAAACGMILYFPKEFSHDIVKMHFHRCHAQLTRIQIEDFATICAIKGYFKEMKMILKNHMDPELITRVISSATQANQSKMMQLLLDECPTMEARLKGVVLRSAILLGHKEAITTLLLHIEKMYGIYFIKQLAEFLQAAISKNYSNQEIWDEIGGMLLYYDEPKPFLDGLTVWGSLDFYEDGQHKKEQTLSALNSYLEMDFLLKPAESIIFTNVYNNDVKENEENHTAIGNQVNNNAKENEEDNIKMIVENKKSEFTM